MAQVQSLGGIVDAEGAPQTVKRLEMSAVSFTDACWYSQSDQTPTWRRLVRSQYIGIAQAQQC